MDATADAINQQNEKDNDKNGFDSEDSE
jgi:hypothetical protein